MNLIAKTSGRLLIPLMIAGLIIGIGVFFLLPNLLAAPPFRWNPRSIKETIFVGESKTVPISFTSPRKLTDVVPRVSPDLLPYVQIEPQQFGVIAKGEQVGLNLLISPPTSFLSKPIRGNIKLVHERKIKIRNPKGGWFERTIDLPVWSSLHVTLTITTHLIAALPPDPGKKGKQTLEGVDSDGDGIRDDVQRYIVLTFPSSEKTRAALTQITQDVQDAIMNADDEDESIEIGQRQIKSIRGFSYILGIEATR